MFEEAVVQKNKHEARAGRGAPGASATMLAGTIASELPSAVLVERYVRVLAPFYKNNPAYKTRRDAVVR